MRDVSVFLISKKIEDSNSIGVEKVVEIKEETPIIRFEDIWSKEFYAANEIGLKLSLRIVISNLNYYEQEELEYMGEIYSIIRTENDKTTDEITLICQKKVKNEK